LRRNIADPKRGGAKVAQPDGQKAGSKQADWGRIAKDPRFVELHRKKMRFLFGWWIVSTLIYLAILISAGTAPRLFGARVIGDMNFGYIIILSSFIYCWFVAGYYASWANRVSDKLTAKLVEEFRQGGTGK
jgi:uncharacterized membrane protein (DUF485 family)